MPAPLNIGGIEIQGIVEATIQELMVYEEEACPYDSNGTNEYRTVCQEWIDFQQHEDWRVSGCKGDRPQSTVGSTGAIKFESESESDYEESTEESDDTDENAPRRIRELSSLSKKLMQKQPAPLKAGPSMPTPARVHAYKVGAGETSKPGISIPPFMGKIWNTLLEQTTASQAVPSLADIIAMPTKASEPVASSSRVAEPDAVISTSGRNRDGGSRSSSSPANQRNQGAKGKALDRS
jgi:hypothetical protein